MAKYLFIFRGGAFMTEPLSPTEMQAHMSKWYAWAKQLGQDGRRVDGQPLQNTGATIRGRDRVVSDGPYVESKDLVTGNMLIEAESLEEATQLARGCPGFEYDGSVEIRPVLEQKA
jgi:hypothetical protein